MQRKRGEVTANPALQEFTCSRRGRTQLSIYRSISPPNNQPRSHHSMRNIVVALFLLLTIGHGVFAQTTKQILENSPSTTVTSASSDPVFSKDRVADCVVPCLNRNAVPLYRSVTANLRQFYVHPIPIVNRDSLNAGIESVRVAAKAMGANAGMQQRYTLSFTL